MATDTRTNTSYWATHFSFPESASPAPIPTQSIPGSTDDNSSSQANQQNYEAAFPFLDGSSEETRLPSPTDSEGNKIDLQTVDLEDVSPTLFSGSFHSAHQLELLNRFGGQLALGSDEGRLDVLLGTDGRTVLILQELTKTDLAQLRLEDQALIAGYLTSTDVPDTVKKSLAATWDVTVGDTIENNRVAANALLDAAIEAIEVAGSSHDDVYVEQLETLKSLVEKNALFSVSGLQAQINAINERFERMHAFESAEAQDAINNAGESDIHYGLNSLDNNASILSGLQAFLNQEQRILDIQKQRLAIVASVFGMDVANLVAMLQLIYNLKQEAAVAVLTEELEQQNALLKDYAEMQRIVNDILKTFPTGEDADEEKRDASGSEDGITITLPITDADSSLTEEEIRALVMFDFSASGPASDGLAHPLESLRGINRPLHEMLVDSKTEFSQDGSITSITLKPHSQSDWNILATQISDANTLMTQQSQILTNDISSFNQQQNRHFDLANNALKRMMDLITSLARA